MNAIKKGIRSALSWPAQRFAQLITSERTALVTALLMTVVASAFQVAAPTSGLAILCTLGAALALSYAGIKPWLKLLLMTLLLLAVVPYAGSLNPGVSALMIQMFIYIALALGLNLVVGFAGLLDLGYIAFFAGGAYVYAIFASSQAARFLPWFAANAPQGLGGWWFWVALPLALLVAALMGIALGLPVMRMRGDYLAIVTLGFGEVIQVIARNLDTPINITGGAPGIAPIQAPTLFGIDMGQPAAMYYIGLVFVVLTAIAMYRIEHSRVGRALAAIREDEIAARAMGVPLVKMKLLAFATGASFSGAMGMLFAVKQHFINPDTFGFMESIGILAMIILGGLGSIRGVIVGAAAVTLLRFQFLPDLSALSNSWGLPSAIDLTKYQPLIFGLILIVMMIYRQDGLIPATRRKENIAALEGPLPVSADGTGTSVAR